MESISKKVICNICDREITSERKRALTIGEKVEAWLLHQPYSSRVHYGNSSDIDICVPCINSFKKWRKERLGL